MKQANKIILIILISFCCMNNIKAEKLVGSNTCYNFNHTTGAYLGSGKNDCLKTIEGSHAYCVEWGKNIKTTIYARDGSWHETSKEAIVAGIIIDKINAKYLGLEAYGTTSAILNTHFSLSKNNAGSYNFYNKNTNIKNVYDAAVNEYNTYKVTTSLPTIKTSYNETLNNLGNNTYISDKITISNLEKTYGGNNDSVSYAITADKGAKICTNPSGVESSCSTSLSITGKKSYDFYIKVNNVNPSEVIRVNITGNNNSTYPSSKLYSGGSSTQKLITKTTTTLNRSTSTSIQLTVPNLTNHTIQAKKVNEQGELLKGAVLEIYQDTPHQGKRLAYDTSSAVLTYTSKLVSAQDDDFFNHDYYLVEKLAPNGYLLKNQTIKIEVSNNENKTICYYNEGNNSDNSQVADNERCNFENYKNVCLGSDGTIKDITENNDCIFEEPKENPEEQDKNTDNTENEEESNETEENKITYEKACYKISTKTIENDNTYCDNKGNYIKVEKARGNVVITHPNEKNKLLISKKAATGDDELVGANLKICTKSNYEANKENCDPAETIEKTKMEWVSREKPKTYSGIPIGNYYIIETIAPSGYAKKSIASEFSVDATGKIESKDMVKDTIIIKNNLTSLSISKQDMTTSKELKGATLSICISYLDENNKIQLEKDQHTGDCIPAILADGTKATWESTDKPHKIEGLPSGTYFLVENIAPKNYSTAESIIFIVSEDGTILDKDRNPIENNKIIMKDKLISNPKTGEIPVMIISIVGFLGLLTGFIFYNKTNKKISKK